MPCSRTRFRSTRACGCCSARRAGTGLNSTSYGQFKTYWKRKLAAIQGGRAGFPNPLRFQVENFNSDKSVGQTTLLAKYTLKVFKGDPAPGNKELAAFQISARVVKGPDRMWYLSSGTLPAERKEAANKAWLGFVNEQPFIPSPPLATSATGRPGR